MRTLTRFQQGLTLTELLVAVLVGSFATLAIFQSFAASEAYRRTATSGGDAAFNGAIGINVIQRDLRMAGFGMNMPTFFGCNVLAHDAGSSPARDFNFTLAPVLITQGTGTEPDRITIAYGNHNDVPAPVRLMQALTAATNDYKVENAFGISAGDLVVLLEAGKDCALAQATNTPLLAVAPSPQDAIVHATGNYTDAKGQLRTARYNKSGGLGPNYTLDAQVMNLGPMPAVTSYYINGNTLVMDQPLTNLTAAGVGANIVQLQAQYGRDTNADGIVDSWSEAALSSQADLATVLAVRVALVARSALPERPDPATGVCDITTASPTWIGGTLDITADANWRCYRYRTYEMTTSLRNQLWRPE